MYQISCSEVWGGNRETDSDVCAGSLTASLFSSSAEGGKGGDIYYFSLCGHGQLTRVAIADVVGHGKVVSDTSQWLYASLASRMDDPGGGVILDDLNKLVTDHGHKAITTAEVITFHAGDSNLKFSRAGHPPFLIKRQNNGGWKKINIENSSRLTNLPLGVLKTVTYDEEIVPVNKGDIIFAYTDGVIETPDSTGKNFGLERLMNVLQANENKAPHQLKQTVLEALKQFSGKSLKHDDVTLMVIKID